MTDKPTTTAVTIRILSDYLTRHACMELLEKVSFVRFDIFDSLRGVEALFQNTVNARGIPEPVVVQAIDPMCAPSSFVFRVEPLRRACLSNPALVRWRKEVEQ